MADHLTFSTLLLFSFGWLIAAGSALAQAPLDDTARRSIFPGPDQFGLDAVQDVRSLAAEDAAAYYGLLHLASTVPDAELEAAAARQVAERRAATGKSTFYDLLNHSAAWRGKPVRLSGRVLQTIEYPAEENAYGIEGLYESQLYAEDSQHHPATIVFLERPDDLPLGSETVEGVTVVGYFLKTYLYPSGDRRTRQAPLILARSVTVTPPPPAASVPPIGWLVGGIAVTLAVLAGLLWRRQQCERDASLRRQRDQLRPPPADLGGPA